MDRRFAFLAVFVALLATGCQQQSAYVSSHLEILGAERRALEDRVLDLEFELEDAQKRLKRHEESGSNSGSSSRSNARSSRETPSSSEDGGESMALPTIEIPGQDDLPGALAPPRVNEGRPAGDLPSPLGGDSAMISPRYQKPTRPIAMRSRPPGDPRITHVELNPTLTGGTDFDRKSGDDGLIVVLEPRNADNEFVPLAGPIIVVLLDYAKREQGSAALVARWNIDATAVHKAIVNDEYARGIQLRLPWPDQKPENSKLRLDVRYTTADGRRLDARADIYVTLPGQFSHRWTPRAPGSGVKRDSLPDDGQPRVNIARQPNEDDSAANARPPLVTQSSFTAVAKAAEIVRGESDSRPMKITRQTEPAAKRVEPESRPSWQPNR